MEKMTVEMSKAQMIQKAREAGYAPTNSFITCPNCTKKAKAALKLIQEVHSELLNKTINGVPWLNPKCAIKFYPKYQKNQTKSVYYGCECGWRKSLTKKPFVKKVPDVICSYPSCTSILTQWDKDHGKEWCGKHRKEGTNPWEDMPETHSIPVEKARVKCKCGNILPPGRKMWCFNCKAAPAAKEGASKPLVA